MLNNINHIISFAMVSGIKSVAAISQNFYMQQVIADWTTPSPGELRGVCRRDPREHCVIQKMPCGTGGGTSARDTSEWFTLRACLLLVHVRTHHWYFGTGLAGNCKVKRKQATGKKTDIDLLQWILYCSWGAKTLFLTVANCGILETVKMIGLFQNKTKHLGKTCLVQLSSPHFSVSDNLLETLTFDSQKTQATY